MSEIPDEQLRVDIIHRVAQDLMGAGLDHPAPSLTTSTWAILDFSSVFWIANEDTGEAVYVKVPKTEITRRRVSGSSEADRRLARGEYESLIQLEHHWNGVNHRIQFVRPLAFYEDLNALVTQRAAGVDLLHSIRRVDTLSKLRLADPSRLEDTFREIGAALGAFHGSSRAGRDFGSRVLDTQKPLGTISKCISSLATTGVDVRLLQRLHESVSRLALPSVPSPISLTLKGLDIRNVLSDNVGDRLYFLDPGRIRADFSAADLGRMIVTIRIVYWGSLRFFLHLQPDRRFEHAFLDGYFGDEPRQEAVIRLFVVKELFKHWRSAHYALSLKSWPDALKAVLRSLYVDPFYASTIARELAAR